MKLSIAMIVKDEEKNLPRCFQSIKTLLDMGVQLVVVDTGSTDRTMGICKQYGAELYQHPWERNFAKHRNQSFSYCKRADWILQLDADETMDFKGRNPSILFEMLEKIPSKFHAGAFAMLDWRAGEPHAEVHAVRIFRQGKVRYERRAHNEPMYKNDAVIIPGIQMNHYGYDLSDEEMVSKASRTISILKEMLDDNPEDYDSMFYLAQSYGSWLKDQKKCLEYAELYYANKENVVALGLKEGNPAKFNTSVFYLISSIYYNLKQYEDCFKWIQIALKEIPGDLDICHLTLRLGLATKNSTLAAIGSRGFVNAFDAYENNRAKKGARFTFHYNVPSLAFALYHLSLTYFEQGKINVDRMFEILDRPDTPKDIKDDIEQGFAKFCEKVGLKYERGSVLVDPNKMQSPSRIITPQLKINPKANLEGLRTPS
jgi:glycosyltransferase involved in cell wall biosynthesis